jgi:hypothetical protein
MSSPIPALERQARGGDRPRDRAGTAAFFRRKGGAALVVDPARLSHPGMAQAALRTAHDADALSSPEEIAHRIAALVGTDELRDQA